MAVLSQTERDLNGGENPSLIVSRTSEGMRASIVDETGRELIASMRFTEQYPGVEVEWAPQEPMLAQIEKMASELESTQFPERLEGKMPRFQTDGLSFTRDGFYIEAAYPVCDHFTIGLRIVFDACRLLGEPLPKPGVQFGLLTDKDHLLDFLHNLKSEIKTEPEARGTAKGRPSALTLGM